VNFQGEGFAPRRRQSQEVLHVALGHYACTPISKPSGHQESALALDVGQQAVACMAPVSVALPVNEGRALDHNRWTLANGHASCDQAAQAAIAALLAPAQWQGRSCPASICTFLLGPNRARDDGNCGPKGAAGYWEIYKL
jgi:hypothetical protein